MKLSLEHVFQKIFKKFLDDNKWLAIKVEDQVEIHKKTGWRTTHKKTLMTLFPACYLYPEGLYNANYQFGQKINSTVKGSLKNDKHVSVSTFLDLLDNVANDIDALEKHLTDLVENSIKLAKYDSQEKYFSSSISIDEIIDIECENERNKATKSIKNILLTEFSDVFNDSNMYFSLSELNDETVYKCLSYIIFKCLLDIEAIDDSTRKKIKRPLEDFERMLSSRNSKTSPIPYSPQIQTLSTEEDYTIKLFTCLELKEKLESFNEIACRILQNDSDIYGDIGEHRGSIHQWSRHMELSPEQWGFLCLETNDEFSIIGNYSCVYLSRTQEKELIAGTLRGNDISNNTVETTLNLARTGENASLYLMNLSVNEKYDNFDNRSLLFNAFGKFVRNEIRKGVMISKIYTTSFIDKYDIIFEKNGFKYLTKRAGRGNFFQMDLTHPLSNRCNWVSYTEPLDEKEFTFRKMLPEDVNNEPLLEEVSMLIHLTDPYIYEEGMMTLKQARIILPRMFSQSDTMFHTNNVFLAISKKTNRVVGILLTKRGPLNWKSDKLKQVASFLGETLKPSLKKVETEYFHRYNNVDCDTLSIINCNVNRNMKLLYGTALEDAMLKAFIKANTQYEMFLYVLRETPDSFDTYCRNGFEFKENCKGFNIHDKELPSSLLIRKKQ